MVDDELDQLWEQIPWSPGSSHICDDSKECNDLIEEQLKFLEEDPFKDPSNPHNDIVTSEARVYKSLGRHKIENEQNHEGSFRVLYPKKRTIELVDLYGLAYEQGRFSTHLITLRKQDAEQQVETRKKAIILSVMES